MEPGERPSVREYLENLRRLEKAVRSVLRRIAANIQIESNDPAVDDMRIAGKAMSGSTDGDDLRNFLVLGIGAIEESNLPRAKVRLVEALHVLVHDPVRLLELPSIQRVSMVDLGPKAEKE